MSDIIEGESTEQDLPEFELTPEAATSLKAPVKLTGGAPPVFARGKVLKVIMIAFSIVISGGFIFNMTAQSKKKTETTTVDRAARSPTEFLNNELERSARRQVAAASEDNDASEIIEGETAETLQTALPEIRFISEDTRPRGAPIAAVEIQQAPQQQSAVPAAPPETAHLSPLKPNVEGLLFAGGNTAPIQGQFSNPPGAAAQYPPAYPAASTNNQSASDPYALQNDQQGKQIFFDTETGGTITGGRYLGAGSLWVGTIISAVLQSGINTDLPGNALARVTRNVYDSQTGKTLLLPQGTLLMAKYNSSVSYAQHRVQIVWDTLIRPDGFQVDLDGMNSIDKQGLSGQDAVYHENWFEYAKAAGIITMFSIANSSMAEEAAKYGGDQTAAGVVSANSNLVNQLGGNIISKALNIQPTLTVAGGTELNVMLGKTLYLPPMK